MKNIINILNLSAVLVAVAALWNDAAEDMLRSVGNKDTGVGC
jgi:hypothetical protein